jgi:hypothetical protein
VALLIASALPALADTRIERELDLAPGGEFEVDTDVGSVELRGTARSGVHVVITSRGDDIESKFDVEFEDGTDRAAVRVSRKGKANKWFSWGRGGNLKFTIEVPQQTRVMVDTAGGSIKVETIDDAVNLDTSGGSITARDIGGDLLADTSGGSISVFNVDGEVEADTSGGSIVVEDATGDVNADTSGGSIRVSRVGGRIHADTSGGSIFVADAADYVYADTSGGSIEVSFESGNSMGGQLSTSGGGIRVQLDPSVDLDIHAEASGGSVIADVPITVQGKISKTSLTGRIGSGGNRLEMSASGGKIRIESR